ncbi:Zinc finger MYM-type protein 1-like [Oopsacas minuta]|uniref:Zinc finger MYM-type protein 1-like n=1 Tax=Oopsacas minuta TaxID=111878 RepID=A0AAV7JU91_9METZ|nr:Zinc finger MYM-type protein 1-like [Oopsacas minuta]
MLNKSHVEQKDENRQVQLKIFSSVRYLGRQVTTFRGRWKTDDPEILNGESDSNFIQLLRIRAEDNPNLLKWLDKCQDKFTSPDIQNEILKLMSLRILRDIVQQISGKMYTIMVEETTDLLNIEQMILCLRHVDDDLNVHEELIGLYSLGSTFADNIMLTIQDIL